MKYQYQVAVKEEDLIFNVKCIMHGINLILKYILITCCCYASLYLTSLQFGGTVDFCPHKIYENSEKQTTF